jgi:hypothetical protein
MHVHVPTRLARLVTAGLVLVAVTLGLAAGPAAAHDPIFLTEDQTSPDTGPYMPDGTISWALYGSVLDSGETRGFEFDLRDGDELYISLLIPNVSPEVELDDAELPTLDLENPDGSTTTIVPEIREVFDEPFSRTSYVTLAELREPAQAGRYRGVVNGNAPARFSVAIGEEEIFFTEAERTGDRPTSFMEIAEPLTAWYSAPPGGERVELADGEGEVDMELLAEAMDEGVAQAPEGAMGDDTDENSTDENSTDENDTDQNETDEALGDEADDDSGSGAGWVAPLVVVIAVALGGGYYLTQRRSAA